jgi:tungstate transport system ATP-binding protein
MVMRADVSILPLTVSGLCFAAPEIEAGRQFVLEDVSFTIPKGGVTAIIGPNGSGKSLTLRLCHGLLIPSAGSVRWQAGSGNIVGTCRHAMVFQRPIMLRRSVRANLAHALAAVRADNAMDRIDAALERFGLAGLAARPARLLSGGEQQRLAIARAWTLAPELLFLDEPCSQLDPGATRQIEHLVAALAAEGMTILMATHDLGQARRLSQRLMFLHKGRLIENTTTERFFTAPATKEARAFIAGDLLW